MAARSNVNTAGLGGYALLGIFIASGAATVLGVIGIFVVKSIDVADSYDRDTSGTDGSPRYFARVSDPSDENKPYWSLIETFYADIDKRVAKLERRRNKDQDPDSIKNHVIKRRGMYDQAQIDFLKTIEYAALREFYQKIINHLGNMPYALPTAASDAKNLYRQMLIYTVEKNNNEFNAEVNKIVNGIKEQLKHQTSGGATSQHFSGIAQDYRHKITQMNDPDDKNYPGREKLKLHLLGELHDAAGRIMHSTSSVTGGGSETTGAKLNALATKIKDAYANFNQDYAQWRQGQQQQPVRQR